MVAPGDADDASDATEATESNTMPSALRSWDSAVADKRPSPRRFPTRKEINMMLR